MNKIPFFDLKRVYEIERKEIEQTVLETLQSGYYILGPKGKQFENELKNYLVGNESGAVIGCNSGTDAIILSLLAMNIGQGDEVITVSHTAIPTITAIQSVGATPVFVDIDPESWVLDVSKVENAITPNTKAVIAVHLYGNMVDVKTLKKVLSKIPNPPSLIEDVAQAQGSTMTNIQAGTTARFGCYSFYPTKNVGALGDGGAIFAKELVDEAKLSQLRFYGQKDRYHANIKHGLNSRLDEIQAAILTVRLKNLERGCRTKTAQMQTYREQLSGLPLKFQKITDGCSPAWHLAVIALESEKVRNDLQSSMESKGVQTLIHYPIPTHLQPAFVGAKYDNLALTESLAKRILSIPLNVGLLANEQQVVIDSIRSFFKSK